MGLIGKGDVQTWLKQNLTTPLSMSALPLIHFLISHRAADGLYTTGAPSSESQTVASVAGTLKKLLMRTPEAGYLTRKRPISCAARSAQEPSEQALEDLSTVIKFDPTNPSPSDPG
jgi:hypothetical protein